MQVYGRKEEHGSPEIIIGRLAHRLRNHALWDSTLIIFPPVLAILYLVGFLYHLSWIPAVHAIVFGSGITAVGLLAVILRFRPRVPSLSSAARLADEKAQAEDRFITLATLAPACCSGALLERLRAEASGLLNRIEIGRDFPYTLKPSFYRSMIGSAAVVILLHLFLITAHFMTPVSPQQRIRELAEQMAQKPSLAEIASGLKALSAKLDDPQASMQEKQSMVQELQTQVEDQQKQEEQQGNKDLLSDASSTLKNLEQQPGDPQQQAQQNDGGGVQSNASQEGHGPGKQSEGGGGDTKGEITAQLNPEMKNGKSTQGDPQGQGQQKNPRDQNQQNAKPSDQSDPDRSNKSESAGKMEASSEGKAGKNRSEDIPRDGPPAERYYQPGEQVREGIKGARYVTVQLPEELATDGNGVSTASKDRKESRNRPKLPVSNVPLPAHVPEAPAEKQRMPLEYRELIR